jgi:hypothetical protein
MHSGPLVHWSSKIAASYAVTAKAARASKRLLSPIAGMRRRNTRSLSSRAHLRDPLAIAPCGLIASLLYLKKKKPPAHSNADGRSLGRKRPRASADTYLICSSAETPDNTGGSSPGTLPIGRVCQP